jgi:hypothetical protein
MLNSFFTTVCALITFAAVAAIVAMQVMELVEYNLL